MPAYIPPPPPRFFGLISAMPEMADRSRALRDEYHAGLVDLANLGSRLDTVALSDEGLQPLKMVPLSDARLADVDSSMSADDEAAAEATAAAYLAPPSWPTSPLHDLHGLSEWDDEEDLVRYEPGSWSGSRARAEENVAVAGENADGVRGTEEGVAGSLDPADVSEHAAGQEEEAGGGQSLVEEEEEVVGSVGEGEEREKEEEYEQPGEDGYEQLGEEDGQPWEGDQQPWEETEQQPEQEEEQQQQSPQQQQQQSQTATVGGNKRARDDEEISTLEQLGSPSKRQCSPEQSSAATPASTSAAVAAAALDDDDDDEPFFYDLRCYHGEVTSMSLIRDSLVMEEGSRSRPVTVAAFAPDGDEGWKTVARALGLETGCHARYKLWDWLHTAELPRLRRGSSREPAERFLKTIFPDGKPIPQAEMDALKEKSENGRLPEKLELSHAYIGFFAQVVRRRILVYSKHHLDWSNSYLLVEADDEDLLQPAAPLLYNSRSWSWKLVELQNSASMPAADFWAWGDVRRDLLNSRTHRSLHRFFSFWVPRMPNEGERPCGCELWADNLDEAEGDDA